MSFLQSWILTAVITGIVLLVLVLREIDRDN